MSSLNRVKTMKDAEIQSWLRKVETVGVNVLVKALLGADETVVERVLRNMSPTAGDQLQKKVDHEAELGISKAEIDYDTKRLELLF